MSESNTASPRQGTASARLSICIPTYNRAAHLANCLESIRVSRAATTHEIQVCVSDNASTDETEAVVRAAQHHMTIQYRRNPENVGMSRNFLKVIEMADAEFVWLLGDDDLVLPDGLERICTLLDQHPTCDFFYVNAFHLTTEYVLSYPQPFSTANLPANMEPFSKWKDDGELPFLDLIDPRISFDFLGGMFLVLFRTAKWRASAGVLNLGTVADSRTYSMFDNTFPHVKVFAHAFPTSTAYFNTAPVGVCLTGAREWAPMYPMVRSVRLVEALREYLKNGLSFWRYVWCKNFALRTFLPDLAFMFVHRETSGFQYINPAKLMLSNCAYPNFYLSFWYYIVRKVKAAVVAPVITTGSTFSGS